MKCTIWTICIGICNSILIDIAGCRCGLQVILVISCAISIPISIFTDASVTYILILLRAGVTVSMANASCNGTSTPAS